MLWVGALKKTEGRLWHGSFFQSIVAWSVQSSCLVRRNTIFNTTIQINHFLPHYLKKKPGKLKGKKKRLSLGERRKAGRNAIRSLQMDRLLPTSKPWKSPGRSPLCTVGHRPGSMGEGRGCLGGLARRFCGVYFLKIFILFCIFSFRDTQRFYFSCLDCFFKKRLKILLLVKSFSSP